MISALATLAGFLLPKLIPSLAGIAEQFKRGEIDKATMQARMHEATQAALAEVGKAHADAIAKTFASFMDASKSSPLMQRVWGAVTLSQLAVLLWHQVGIPAYVHWTGLPYPSSGATVEWAYLLLAFCLGGGPILLRGGPGK